MKERPLIIPLLSSCLIHAAVIMFAAMPAQKSAMSRANFIPVGLIDPPRPTETAPIRKPEPPREVKKPAPVKKITPPKPTPARKPEIVKPQSAPKQEIAEPPKPAPPRKEEAVKPAETTTPPAASLQTFASGSKVEGGGSEAGAGTLSEKDDVGVVPGAGTSGGGGGTAVSGLGRGSGAPGLPAQNALLKTNREAQPVKTARATYPPMALRMGLESDVTLKIEVDPTGEVTRAEIIKSGGPGFDEEALKAVKQSRFEPAQRNGQVAAAEFTYVYRFRLRR